MTMEPLLCLGCFFLLAGFVTDVISTASREWVVNADGANSGLWTVCRGTGQCMSMGRQDSLDGVRSVMVLSVIISGINLLFVIMKSIWVNGTTNRWLLRTIALLTLLSALLALAGVLATLAIDWSITNARYEYSYWLAVASATIFSISTILFLASVIRHNNEHQRMREINQNIGRKEYPFIIPYYNYKNEPTQENEPTTLDNELRNEGMRPETAPFQYDYRYYSTKPLPFGVYSNEDTGVINASFRDSHNNSAGFNNVHLQSNEIKETSNTAIENYKHSFYSRDRLTEVPANLASNTGNIRSSNAITSGLFAHSMYSKSFPTTRVPRDDLGYPLNYYLELS